MAQSNEVQILSVATTNSITAETFVAHGSNPATAGAGVNSIGVAISDSENGYVPVATLGTAVALSGAAVAAGDALELNASGKVITRTSGAIVGRALEAASGADERIEVMLIPN